MKYEYMKESRADASVLPVSEVFAEAAHFPKCKISLYDFV